MKSIQQYACKHSMTTTFGTLKTFTLWILPNFNYGNCLYITLPQVVPPVLGHSKQRSTQFGFQSVLFAETIRCRSDMWSCMPGGLRSAGSYNL